MKNVKLGFDSQLYSPKIKNNNKKNLETGHYSSLISA